jgi:NodT family efflux transporter outer membrane factor (OMF) lipoprotein
MKPLRCLYLLISNATNRFTFQPRESSLKSSIKNLFVALGIILSGCMVGPDYQKPDISMPLQFAESPAELMSSENTLFQWWKQFEDPFLNQLIEEAYQANFDFRIALEQILAARAQYKIKSSLLWPEIDLNAMAIRSRNSQSVFGNTTTDTDISALGASSVGGATSSFGSFGPPVQNFFQIGFDAIWELDIFGKFRRSKKAAHEDWEASRDIAQNVLITALSEVARDYVAICALQKKIELVQQKIALAEQQLVLTIELFEAGLSSEIQVANIAATLEQDRAELPILQTSLDQTIYALAVLLGRQPESLIAEFEEVRPIPSGIDRVPLGLPSDLLRRRPDIRAAERQLAAATDRIGAAVADLFPHISLTGDSYGYASQKLNKWFKPKSRFWSIGPTINWDLIDFGRTRGFIDVAKSEQRQALLNYEKTVVTSLQDVEGALVAYFEEQKRQDFIFQQVEVDRRSLELVQDLFKSGLSSELEVLQAQVTLVDAEITLVDSTQSLTSDLIAIYKALGGDWECSFSP